ncbi:MAG TPA: sulfite exporter TauE/SafE family protein [Bacteroidota bacterium]
MDLSRAAILLGAGALAGLMNSIAGGGTIVTFPALIVSGLSSIVANATSTIALLPGTVSMVFGYRRNIPAIRWWLKLFAPVSLVGGLIGGILLVHTPTRVFDWLVPFLILFATILFMANAAVSRFFRPQGKEPSRRWLWGAIAFQFGVALYGGYFGAGIGILMLASLGMLGFADVHEMNTVKTILGFLINIVAAVYFVMSAIVDWPSAAVMAVGTIAGGFSGAHFSQKVDQKVVRSLITLIGLTLSALMFFRQFS